VTPLQEAVQHLLDTPIRPLEHAYCEFCCEADVEVPIPLEMPCPWCGVEVDDRLNGNHPLTCPYYQLQRAAVSAVINVPHPTGGMSIGASPAGGVYEGKP
jgi:hypothetical protein